MHHSRIFLLKILLLCGIILSAKQGLSADKVLVEFFFNPHCEECRTIETVQMPILHEELPDCFTLKNYDLSEEENFLLLIARLEALHDQSNEKVYIIVNRKIVLAGYREIEQRLRSTVRAQYGKSAASPSEFSNREGLLKRTELRMTFWAIIGAGLLDGINPCVFTTLIFFISLLGAGNVSRKRMAMVGLVYIVGCFLTYLAIGAGLYQVLHFSFFTGKIKIVLNTTVAVLLLFCGIGAFYDIHVFLRRGSAAVRFQLPPRWRDTIHGLMRRVRHSAFLLPLVFVMSVAVTIIESVCTGQVYVPTLLLLSQTADGVNIWWSYLLLYNLMFILPLIAIFGIAWIGMKTALLLQLSRRNLIVSKLLTGLFLWGMGVLLLIVSWR